MEIRLDEKEIRIVLSALERSGDDRDDVIRDKIASQLIDYGGVKVFDEEEEPD